MATLVVSRVSRSMHRRKVVVLLRATNLQEQPIHRIAMQEGFDYVCLTSASLLLSK